MVLTEELERVAHSSSILKCNFSFTVTTHVSCTCGTVHISYNEMVDLSLDLQRHRTIQNAIDEYFSDDDIQFRCDSCLSVDIAKKKYFLLTAPECLFVQLRRFSPTGIKIHDTIELSLELELKRHFLEDQDLQWKYKLVAVVNHFGESLNVGHYNTIALTSNGQCYEFDDRNVREVSSSLVSGRNAYILLYELVAVKLFIIYFSVRVTS